MRKFSKFAVAIPSHYARFGGLTISVYTLNPKNPTIEYNLENSRVPQDIHEAVVGWVKNNEFGGLTLSEYLNTMFKPSDFNL